MQLKYLRKSKLSEAVQYTLNQWIYLIRFLRHGSVEIGYKLGRKSGETDSTGSS